MNHRQWQWRRREFVTFGAAAFSLLCRRQALFAAEPSRVQHLLLRYRTDPERIKRIVPPGLLPSETSEVLVDCSFAVPGESRRGAVPRQPVGACWVRAAVKQEAVRGTLLLGGWTSLDWPRIYGREFLSLNLKDGIVRLEKEGGLIRAAVERRNAVALRVETKLLEEQVESSSSDSWSENQGDLFAYSYRLSPDWHNSLFGETKIELLRIPADETSVLRPAGGDRSLQKCDLGETGLTWPAPSDPSLGVELPVVEWLDAVFQESQQPEDDLGLLSHWGEPASVATLDKQTFASWAFFNYDRPAADKSGPRAGGGPPASVGFRLTPREMEAYRQREEIELAPIDLIDIQLVSEKQIGPNILPPPCSTGSRPRLRILGLRVESSDLSPAPFYEVWLFASCVAAEQAGWYALSHIVTGGGDVLLGRETFGYPSKSGEVDVGVTPQGFILQGRRFGREFLYAEGGFRGMSTGTSLSQMPIFGMRARRSEDGSFEGQLIQQQWYFQGTHYLVDRERIAVELPADPSRRSEEQKDPWHEFNPFQVVSVSVAVHAGLQRAPGQVVAELPDVDAYYRERCDGLLPGSPLSAEPSDPTFVIKDPPARQS